jgi:inosine-uridine nucleoside N-ribohydrolase
MSVLHPSLFTMHPMPGDVETLGELTQGMTVFDRRRVPAWRHNMEVAVEMKKDEVVERIVQGLNRAAG